MNTIKHICVIITMPILLAMITSCDSEKMDLNPNAHNMGIKQDYNLSEEFSIILSKALYENTKLREFIRDISIKQFDKDYDVFYPWVCNLIVDEDLTFYDIISRYDEKGILPIVEKELPLLNIYVPDWSWLNGFCANNWDVNNNDISVIYTDNSGAKTVCYNGVSEFSLKNNQVPGFPCVIVTRNERMKVTTTTKVDGALEYDFIDDEFNASIFPSTKVTHQYFDRDIDTENYSNFVSATEMQNRSNVSITAYNTFVDNPNAAHRDNIYYGMTNSIQQGKLNNHISEYIAKIRLGTINSQFLFEGDDFSGCPESYTRYVAIDDDVLIQKFVYEGNLELYFQIFIGNNSGTATEVVKFKSISFNDVFQLAKVHVDFKHKTWFTDRKWVFTVDKQCFVPKWYDANIQLPKWDISNQSTIINIKVSEFDNNVEVTTTETIVNSTTNNFSIDGSGTVSGNFGNNSTTSEIGNGSASGSIKVGYGTSSKNETTETVVTKTKEQSDDLGTALLYYTDPVILSSETFDGVDGYRVKEIDTGFVYMLILPRYE